MSVDKRVTELTALTAPAYNDFLYIVDSSDSADASKKLQLSDLASYITVNVESFGAVGDGVTDDTAAIQAAATYMDSFASVVVKRPKLTFSPGKIYLTSDEITFARTCHIDGQGAQIKTSLSDASKSALVLGDATTSTYTWKIQDLTIGTTGGTSLSSGVTVNRFYQGVFDRVYISAFTKQLVLSSDGSDPFCGWLTVHKCYFQGGDYGITGDGTPCNVIDIKNSRFIQHDVTAIYFDPATGVTIKNNDFSDCLRAVHIENGGGVRLEENYTEKCGSGTENNSDILVYLNNCNSVDINGQTMGGSFENWRSRKGVNIGIACYACKSTRIENNSFTYFRQAAVYFDSATETGCIERNNSYTENFSSDSIGNKVQDDSGNVDVEGTRLPDAAYEKVPYVENYCTAPRDIFNNWTIGADTTVTSNGGTSMPYFDDSGDCDSIEFLDTGSAKSITINTANVVGATGQKFKLRFWANLRSVVSTSPLAGTATLRVRLLDGAAVLKEQYITISPMWKMYEVECTDTKVAAHAVTISIQAGDTVYQEFTWECCGIQYARSEAPYIYDNHTSVASYSRAYDAAPEIWPKIIKQDEFTFVQILDTAAPASGTWAVGDKCYNRSPSVDGNNMVLDHWVCTVAGTPGTWVAQYISTVSPAT